MIKKHLIVRNRAGIHTRPAAEIVKRTQKFQSEITFVKDDMEINGKSIMGVITLGSPYKDEIDMVCEGPDEEELANCIDKFFKNRFEED